MAWELLELFLGLEVLVSAIIYIPLVHRHCGWHRVWVYTQAPDIMEAVSCSPPEHKHASGYLAVALR